MHDPLCHLGLSAILSFPQCFIHQETHLFGVSLGFLEISLGYALHIHLRLHLEAAHVVASIQTVVLLLIHKYTASIPNAVDVRFVLVVLNR